MSSYAFVNYVRFRQFDGTYTAYAFQNFSVNQTRTYNSISHSFAPFAIATGGGEKGGDRSSNTLVTGSSTQAGSTIILNLFKQAVADRWLVEIKTVSLNISSFADDALISTETWRVASYEFDDASINLRLSSPLDAAKSQVPTRRLSSELVGALPVSGSVSTR